MQKKANKPARPDLMEISREVRGWLGLAVRIWTAVVLTVSPGQASDMPEKEAPVVSPPAKNDALQAVMPPPP